MTRQGAQHRLRPFAIPPHGLKIRIPVQPQRWKCAAKLDNLCTIATRSVPDQQQGSRVMAISSAKKPDARKSSATAKPAAKAAPKVAKPMAKAAPKATVAAPKSVAAEAASESMSEIILTPAMPEEKQARVTAPQLKKKELVARVVAALDGKKKGGVKEIVEATLAAMGEALQKGESLNIPPFGRARVARQKGEGADQMTTVRLRGAGSKNAPKGGKQALAEVGEDD